MIYLNAGSRGQRSTLLKFKEKLNHLLKMILGFKVSSQNVWERNEYLFHLKKSHFYHQKTHQRRVLIKGNLHQTPNNFKIIYEFGNMVAIFQVWCFSTVSLTIFVDIKRSIRTRAVTRSISLTFIRHWWWWQCDE